MPAFALHVDSCKKLFEHFKLRKKSFNFALVAIGSVIVDLEEFGILKRVHGRAEEFLQHLLKTEPKYAPLAIGMIMHEELDRVIDAKFVNPQLPKAKELLEQYEFSTEKVALAAHYLIDHTVNCTVLEKEPELIKISEGVKKKLSHKHAHKIAYHLAMFFEADKDQVMKALHAFRDFDLSQYLSQDSSAALYAKFLFLQEELKERTPISIVDKIKLGLNYGKFILGHKKHQTKELFFSAKEKFSNHKQAYKQACKAMVKRLTKISTLHTISLK